MNYERWLIIHVQDEQNQWNFIYEIPNPEDEREYLLQCENSKET